MGLRCCCTLALIALATGCGREGNGNRPPIAAAGEDSLAWVGEPVSLDGSASVDLDEEPIAFSWRVLTGPTGYAPGEIGQNAVVDFVPPIAGTYVIALEVSDGVTQAQDVVAVTARVPLDVLAVSPQHGAEAFDRAPVVVIFSAPLRPWTADEILVEDVSGAPLAVLGSVSMEDGNTSLVFSPADAWVAGTLYRVSIGGAILGIDGAPLRSPVTVEFTGAASDTAPPRVVAVTPANASTGRSASTFVDLLFSEPVDTATLSGASFTLTQSGGAALPATITLSAGGVRALLVATNGSGSPAMLAADTDHAIDVTAAVLDLSGLALDGNGDGTGGDAFASVFRTAAGSDTDPPRVVSINPFFGASGVSVKMPIAVQFSEPIDPLSLDATTLVVTTAGGTAPIAGTISFGVGNTVAIFEAEANLRTASRYDLLVGATVRDLAQNALGFEERSFWITGAAPPPAVSAANPGIISVNTTETIEISGEDFVDGASVAVLGGGVVVGNVTWLGPDLLQAELTLSPTAALGDRAIRVINPDGQAGTGLNVLTVTPKPPTVISLNPSARQRGTTGNIVIAGTDFRNVPSNPTVSFSGAGVTVNSVTYDSSTQLTAGVTIASGAAPGPRAVTVTNPGGLADTLLDGFIVQLPAPTITSLGTTSARRKASATVVVNGTSFGAGATVTFGGGISVDSVTVVSATRIDADISVNATALLGTRNVTVTNADGQSATLTAGFTVNRALPVVTNVNPAEGSRQGGAMAIALTGMDFDCSMAPTTVPAIAFATGMTVSSISCGGATGNAEMALTATLSIGATATLGTKNVTVTNPGDTASTSLGLFTVNPEAPTLTSATPNPDQGETATVTITGNYFQATPTVSIGGGIIVNGVTFVSATQLGVDLTVPFTTTTGAKTVTVTNPDGQMAAAAILTVDVAPDPVVSSCTPDFGQQGSTGLDVTINGSNFQPGAGATTVAFSGAGITVTNVMVSSPTQIVATVSIGAAATLGARDVTVTNPVGVTPSATATGVFTVTGPAPTITSVVPNTGAQGNTVPGVQINGANFRAGANVSFGAGITPAITNLTATQITCNLTIGAGAPSGFHDVTVTNTDLSAATLPNGFTVTSAGGGPTVSSINSRGVAFVKGRTVSVEITGANFVAGATVTVSGAAADVVESATTLRSDTRLQVNLTAACTDFALGFRDLTVTNPNGLGDTLENALFIRDGIVVNEVITEKVTSEDEIEIFNGRGAPCNGVAARNITGYQIEVLTQADRYVYEIATTTGSTIVEQYSGGHSATNFLPGAFVTLNKVDNSTMADDVYIVLFSPTGRLIDDVEIGHDPEFDGNDGAPTASATNDGGNQGSSAKESVGRCPDGADTENDADDFYQDDVAGVEMARTHRASNNGQCTQCSDGLDNDGDGWIDLLDDGCGSVTDNTESQASTAQCNDGMNNDGVGGIDELDVDCFSAADNDESS